MPYTVTDREASVVATGVKKSYGELVVLDGIDLTVERGSLLALLGPNGAGKTTTVRILSTLLEPDEGVVTIEGHDTRRDAARVRQMSGLTGQFTAVDELLTGRENLVMIGRLHHVRKRQAARRASELLEQFDLVEAADRQAKTYSGGMRRRLDLAACLLAAPPVLFLDEPTTGLDPRSRQALWATIRSLLAGGTTVLLTTQYLEEADQLADRIAVIDGGRIIAEGTAGELKRTVGEERLELVLGRADDVGRAMALLGERATETDAGTRRVSVAVDDADQVRQHLNHLDLADIAIESLTLSKPTLDDVFLTLTGSAAQNGASA